MLISIIRMPPVFGIPIDRSLHVHLNQGQRQVVDPANVYWPSIPFSQSDFVAGSIIDRKPSHLYKAIHVSHNDRYVFETVFSVEALTTVCLYTKIIDATSTTTAISLPSIHYYQSRKDPIYPTSYFTMPQASPNIVDNIVPPTFGENGLWAYVQRMIDIRSQQGSDARFGMIYKPIHDHVPAVFEALLHGDFPKSPFGEIMVSYPMIDIQKDKWFSYEELAFSMNARGGESFMNPPGFDTIALSAMSMSPTKFSLTSSVVNAIDGHSNLWTVQDFHDPYSPVIRGAMRGKRWFLENMSDLFYQAAMLYCRLYGVETEIYYRTSPMHTVDQSSITITKNIHDEISVTVHDLIHERYVCFYMSFPALALSTLSVSRRP